MPSFSLKLQLTELLSVHSSHQPWEARKEEENDAGRRHCLAAGLPSIPCLQCLHGCKLGKGSSMRTAICVPGVVPRQGWGIVFPTHTPGWSPSQVHR